MNTKPLTNSYRKRIQHISQRNTEIEESGIKAFSFIPVNDTEKQKQQISENQRLANLESSSMFIDERTLTAAEERYEQEVLLELLYKIKNTDFSLTMVDAVCILCENLGMETDDFYRNCGNIVKQAIKKDAINNRLIPTRTLKLHASLDDFFS